MASEKSDVEMEDGESQDADGGGNCVPVSFLGASSGDVPADARGDDDDGKDGEFQDADDDAGHAIIGFAAAAGRQDEEEKEENGGAGGGRMNVKL